MSVSVATITMITVTMVVHLRMMGMTDSLHNGIETIMAVSCVFNYTFGAISFVQSVAA